VKTKAIFSRKYTKVRLYCRHTHVIRTLEHSCIPLPMGLLPIIRSSEWVQPQYLSPNNIITPVATIKITTCHYSIVINRDGAEFMNKLMLVSAIKVKVKLLSFFSVGTTNEDMCSLGGGGYRTERWERKNDSLFSPEGPL
jgi:hypothetical protein